MHDLFYSVVWSQLVKSIAARIILALALSPESFLGGLGITIITKSLKVITDIIYESIVMLIDVKTIQFKNKILKARWEVASDILEVALIEHGQDSEEFKVQHKREQERFYETFTFNTRNTNH